MPRLDKSSGTVVLSGAVVVLAAIIGIDCAATATASLGRLHKSTAIVAHAVAPSKSTGLAAGASLTWTAAAFLILVLLRQSPVLSSLDPAGSSIRPSCYAWPAISLLRRKFTASYRCGGRYGP